MSEMRMEKSGAAKGVAADGITQMTDGEFRLFSELIYSGFGIKMPPNKRLMLSSRLRKRLKDIGVNSYKQYYDYVCSSEGNGDEFNRMIDVVTTNKTDFFRESTHFDILREDVVPELTRRPSFRNERMLHFWSAGCSTGEEPYTLSIVLSDYFSGKTNCFRILGTDISKQVLAAAMQAVYSENAIKPIPLEFRKKYLLRGKGSRKGLFRIVPELRATVTFGQLNFLERDFNVRTKMDVIFCRNVVIYFDRKTQIELFNKFYDQLVPGGYLFIGSSESLHGINSKFIAVGPTVYQKPF